MPALRDEALRVGTQPCAALTKPGTEAAAAGTQGLRFPSDTHAPRMICTDSTSRVCGLGFGFFFSFLKAAGWHTGRHGREARPWLIPKAATTVLTGVALSIWGCGPHYCPTAPALWRGEGGSVGALLAPPAPPPPWAHPGTHGCPADPRRRAPGMHRAAPQCDARRRGQCPEGSLGQHQEQRGFWSAPRHRKQGRARAAPRWGEARRGGAKPRPGARAPGRGGEAGPSAAAILWLSGRRPAHGCGVWHPEGAAVRQ